MLKTKKLWNLTQNLQKTVCQSFCSLKKNHYLFMLIVLHYYVPKRTMNNKFLIQILVMQKMLHTLVRKKAELCGRANLKITASNYTSFTLNPYTVSVPCFIKQETLNYHMSTKRFSFGVSLISSCISLIC